MSSKRFRYSGRLLAASLALVASAAHAKNYFEAWTGNGSYCASDEYRGMCGPGGNVFTGDDPDWGVTYCRGMAEKYGCRPLTDLRYSFEKGAKTSTPSKTSTPLRPPPQAPQFTHWATNNEVDWQGHPTYKVYVQNQGGFPLGCSVTISYDQTQSGQTQSLTYQFTVSPAAYGTDSGGLSGSTGVDGASIVGRGYQVSCRGMG